MKYLRAYSIPFRGLKDDWHEFDFEVTNKFFESFEGSEVKKGQLDCLVRMNKTPRFLELFFSIRGQVELVCDRCLELYRQEVSLDEDILMKFGEGEDEDEHIMYIPDHQAEVQLAQLIYEFIVTHLPLKRVHTHGEDCNQDMLERIDHLREEHASIEKRGNPFDQLKELRKKL